MAAIVGFLPVMGWNKGYPSTPGCFFMQIIDMNYMMFNAIVVIYIPLFVMVVLYGFIYRAVREQVSLSLFNFNWLRIEVKSSNIQVRAQDRDMRSSTV